MSHEITIQPYRIVPCDPGHPLDEYIRKDIIDYFDHASDCRIIAREDNQTVVNADTCRESRGNIASAAGYG